MLYDYSVFIQLQTGFSTYYVRCDDKIVLAISIPSALIHTITSVHVKKIKSGYYQVSICTNNKRTSTWSATVVNNNRKVAYGVRDLLNEILVLIPRTQTKLLANTDFSAAI